MTHPSLIDPCPEPSPGISTHLFLTLINTLFASKCQISSPDNYPSDYNQHLVDGDEFDFIVVGGGSAGSAAANLLSENPNWKVLVLEAGTLPSVTAEIPSVLFSVQGTAEDWQYATEPTNKYCLGFKEQKCLWPRGKCLGGSSSINAMMYVRGNQRDYDQWSQLGNPGWEYSSVLETYKQMEDIQVEDLKDSTKYGRGGQIPLTRYKSNEPIIEIIKESAGVLGVPSVSQEENLGYYEAVQTIEAGVRANTGKVFLGRVKQRQNLKVALNTFVEKLLIENKQVVGVLVDLNGRKIEIKARKEVILSAGAINSPQILMLSGIGPKQHLDNLGIPLIVDLPVGENLQDHLMYTGLYISLPNSIVKPNLRPLDVLYNYFMYREGEAAQVSITNFVGHVNTLNDSAYPNIQIFHVLFPKNDNYLLGEIQRVINYREEIVTIQRKTNMESPTLQILPLLLNPKSSGKILLNSNNPKDKPLIYANYLEQPEDVETLLEGIKFILKLLETDAFKKYEPRLVDMGLKECQGVEYKSDDYWRCALKYLATTLYHPVGTCKMAPRTNKGVVDSRLRVYGIDNLRVIDASIMPNITSANTNGPVMMIGRKGASFVVEDWNRLHQEL